MKIRIFQTLESRANRSWLHDKIIGCQWQLATLKTKNKLIQIEKEFMKIRQNTTRFDSECIKFPALKEIDSFTPGLEAIILNIANTINKTGRKREIDADDILKKVLANGRKVKKYFFHDSLGLWVQNLRPPFNGILHYGHEYMQMQPNFMSKEHARHIWNVFPIDDENQQMSEFHEIYMIYDNL